MSEIIPSIKLLGLKFSVTLKVMILSFFQINPRAKFFSYNPWCNIMYSCLLQNEILLFLKIKKLTSTLFFGELVSGCFSRKQVKFF